MSHGSREQSSGIDQIGKALSQMEQVTQTTAANAEESAAAAEQLNAQSESMRELTERLNMMVGANVGNSVSPKKQDMASFSRKQARAQSVPSVAARGTHKPFSVRAKRGAPTDTFPLEEDFSSF